MTEENLPIKKNSKKLVKSLAVIFIVTTLTAVCLMLIGNKMRMDAVRELQEKENYQNSLSENCECLERGRLTCSEGFEMKNDSCRDVRNFYTNKLLSCSKYNCSDGIKLWNNQTEEWGNVTG